MCVIPWCYEWIEEHARFSPQTVEIVDMASCPVVCQKSGFHRKSDFQNFPKLDPLEITAKKFQDKIC
jgi:hypothetical protein